MVERIYSFVIDFFAPSIETTHRKQQKGVLAREQHRKIFNALCERDLPKALEAVEESILSWKQFATGHYAHREAVEKKERVVEEARNAGHDTST
jgi:DNA-binding FadR family transcriptional regulator